MATSGGFSEARLARMHDVLAGHVERDAVAGAVTLISRHGETRVDTIGHQELGHGDPGR